MIKIARIAMRIVRCCNVVDIPLITRQFLSTCPGYWSGAGLEDGLDIPLITTQFQSNCSGYWWGADLEDGWLGEVLTGWMGEIKELRKRPARGRRAGADRETKEMRRNDVYDIIVS